MKALILAAGKSTRLGALGAATPKPMLPLRGRPVLDWTLDELQAAGVTDLAINLHHAPTVIPSHLGDGVTRGFRITYFFEETLLGTAGAVRNARSFLQDEPFMVVYGDTVLDWDPIPMMNEHRRHRPIATIVISEVEDPSRLGVVCLGPERRIEAFVEKPGHRPALGRFVNSGVCILEPSVFEHLPSHGFCDLGAHVFPVLLQRGLFLRAYPRPRPMHVIDTAEQYAAAQARWAPEAHFESVTRQSI